MRVLNCLAQTTAHAVALTLGMLALYPEEQQSVYQQIQEYTFDGLLVSVGLKIKRTTR